MNRKSTIAIVLALGCFLQGLHAQDVLGGDGAEGACCDASAKVVCTQTTEAECPGVYVGEGIACAGDLCPVCLCDGNADGGAEFNPQDILAIINCINNSSNCLDCSCCGEPLSAGQLNRCDLNCDGNVTALDIGRIVCRLLGGGGETCCTPALVIAGDACCCGSVCQEVDNPEACTADPLCELQPGKTCTDTDIACEPWQACCVCEQEVIECENVSPTFCTDAGWKPQGPNSECATTDCGGVQACCIVDGAVSCLDRIPECCIDDRDGQPQGPNTQCLGASNPGGVDAACCREPNGCSGDVDGDGFETLRDALIVQACVAQSLAECPFADMDCDEDVDDADVAAVLCLIDNTDAQCCLPFKRACCLDDGNCIDLTVESCEGVGGISAADRLTCTDVEGTPLDCDPFVCGYRADVDHSDIRDREDMLLVAACVNQLPLRACGAMDVDCNGVVDLADVANVMCQIEQATLMQNDTLCNADFDTNPMGACSFFKGDGFEKQCVAVTKTACSYISDSWDSGVSCPTQACCLNDQTCLDVTKAACTAQGGTPTDKGTSCDVDDPCALAFEACCVSLAPDGVCDVRSPEDCPAGRSRGPGTSCDGVTCCDVNLDCDDGDDCTFDGCLNFQCVHIDNPVKLGDFTGVTDAGFDCVPDGTVDFPSDLRVWIESFQGNCTGCAFHCTDDAVGSCIQPANTGSARGRTTSTGVGQITLVPSPHRVHAGEVVDVDVYLSGASDLGGYQVSLVGTGGRSGWLELTDALVNTDRGDFVLGRVPSIALGDTSGGRFGALAYDDAVDPMDMAYLGTVSFRASLDATGSFQVGLRSEGTSLVDSQGRVLQFEGESVVIRVEAKKGRSRRR